MADVELVIKITEDAYELVKSKKLDWLGADHILKAVDEGTPLPKGHGKIVDLGKIDKDRIEKDNPVIYLTVNGEYIEAISLNYLNGLPTIIEADKAESEEN